MVPGPDCMEDGRMCPNGIHHAALGCVPDGHLAIQPVHDSVLQVLIIFVSFPSKVLHLQEEVKVQWCHVHTVWRMVECVPMEFIMQHLGAA